MLVAQTREPEAEVDSTPPRQAGQVASPQPYCYLPIGTLGWVLCAQFLSWALEGRRHDNLGRASWPFASFVITFLLPYCGVDVTACWIELRWVENPASGSHQGLPV